MGIDRESSRRFQLGQFLAASGSAASLAALVIVLLDKTAASAKADPQLVIWRIALAVMSLMAIGATVTLTIDQVYSAITNDTLGTRGKTLRAFVACIIGVFFTAIFVDGLFAALYWTWWMGSILGDIFYSLGLKR